MAVIKHSDLFDFDGYKKAIKEVDQASKEFGTTMESIVKRISAQYQDVRGEVKALNDILNAIQPTKSNIPALVEQGAVIDKLVSKVEQQKRAMEGLTNVVDLNNRATTELKAAAAGLKKEYEGLAGRSDDVKAKKAALASEYNRVTAAIKTQADALKTGTQVMNVAEGSYRAMQAELTRIGTELKALPNAFDSVTGKLNTNNAQAAALSKRYLELNTSLKAADAVMGNYQRNVGNYTQATFALNQVLREAPAFAMNMQTGFMAISNNLPILFDQFSQLKNTIDENTGKAMGAGKAFGIFAKSIFSVGNLLTIGVTLLTVYGADLVKFIGNLFKGSNAIDVMAESQKAWNDVMSEANKKAAEELTNARLLYQAATDTALSTDKRRIAVDKLQKLYPDIFKNIRDEVIMNGKAQGSYETLTQSILANARAAAARAKIVDIEGKILDTEENDRLSKEKLVKNISDINKKDYSSINLGGYYGIGGGGGGGSNPDMTMTPEEIRLNEKLKVEETYRNERIKSNRERELLNAQIKFLEDKVGASALVDTVGGTGSSSRSSGKSQSGSSAADKIKEQQDLYKSIYDLAVSANEKALEANLITETQYNQTKLQLAKNFANDAIKAEETLGAKANQSKINEYKKGLEDAEKEYLKTEKKITEEQRKNRISEIESETKEKQAGLREDYLASIENKQLTDNERLRMEAKHQNDLDLILIDGLERRAELEIDAEKKKDLLTQVKNLRTGIGKRINDTELKVGDNTMSLELAAEDKSFKLLKARRNLSFEDEMKHLERIKDIKKKHGKDTAQEEIEIETRKAERIKELRQQEAEFYGNISKQGIDIANTLFKGASDNRIAQFEAEKERELTLAGNNQQAREAIEKRYNERVKQEKRKQAIADKAAALFEIAINTAVAVSKVHGQTGIFGLAASIPIIIQGALQAALVAAKPIPQYRTGTRYAQEGLAQVDEAGSELIVDKHGNLKELGNGKPRLTWLNEGDRVYTHMETKDILKNDFLAPSRAFSGIGEKKAEYEVRQMAKAMGGMSEETLTRAFEKAISKIPVEQWLFDEDGLRKRIKKQNERTTYLNNLGRI